MSTLPDALRERLDGLVAQDRVVLFMKGRRTAPQCGFSARVVGILDGHLDTYATVDILADDDVRSGMKVYADWPTFPQLWVDGQLVGGCDIVEQMEAGGELATALGVTETRAPAVTVTDAARDRIAAALQGTDVRLRLRIDRRFDHAFEDASDGPQPGDVVVVANGLTLLFDRASAARADGLTLDFVDGEHASLVIDNPNEPQGVRPLAVDAYARWRTEGVAHELIDVRTPMEHGLARLDDAHLAGPKTMDWLEGLPKDTTIVVMCHHGMRSQAAAEQLVSRGFTDVHNLEGGIDAWSIHVDPSVPRY